MVVKSFPPQLENKVNCLPGQFEKKPNQQMKSDEQFKKQLPILLDKSSEVEQIIEEPITTQISLSLSKQLVSTPTSQVEVISREPIAETKSPFPKPFTESVEVPSGDKYIIKHSNADQFTEHVVKRRVTGNDVLNKLLSQPIFPSNSDNMNYDENDASYMDYEFEQDINNEIMSETDDYDNTSTNEDVLDELQAMFSEDNSSISSSDDDSDFEMTPFYPLELKHKENMMSENMMSENMINQEKPPDVDATPIDSNVSILFISYLDIIIFAL